MGFFELELNGVIHHMTRAQLEELERTAEIELLESDPDWQAYAEAESKRAEEELKKHE